MHSTIPLTTFTLLLANSLAFGQPQYTKKATRSETIQAILASAKMPTLAGPWYYAGPFNSPKHADVHPPERNVDLTAKYTDKQGTKFGWKEFKGFSLGKIVNLKLFGAQSNHCSIFLYHSFEVTQAVDLPLSLGSDDGITVYLDGKKILDIETVRPAAPSQDEVILKLQPGKHELLIKVTNQTGEWAVYVQPELPKSLPIDIRSPFSRDFPKPGSPSSSHSSAAEAKHYRIETLDLPEYVVMEAGGLAFRPDGKLLACTRRGDIWLIDYPHDPSKMKVSRFATGLHEALGLWVQDNNTVYVVQRPELTKLTDTNGDGVADQFTTICDRWGISGDYHEYAFGPARDKDGNFFITLNVGFGGGHQAKAPWRGWCVKIDPKGQMTPYATGLRSPNGVNFSPDGDLFYCDNQGEWVATNKMHHIREGEFYGHQAGLRWLKASPFAKTLSEKVEFGMLNDGQRSSGNNAKKTLPNFTPPAIWFPYGKMGQSASEPIWDTTGGKFGPFAGQCLVGDQTRAMIMRVALEKVNGRYQGACFAFRSGFQCGINRLCFGPDGSLYVGQTARGWGSVGGKPYGLQRLVYEGMTPFEIKTMNLTKTGFELTFTKPIDKASISQVSNYALESYTYNYWPNYGSPEVDRRAEKITGVQVADNGLKVTLTVSNLRVGRVYGLSVIGCLDSTGEPLLHSEAWYTLNNLHP